MYRAGPCQINQPRKIKPAERFLFFPGLTQRSISVAMPVYASPRQGYLGGKGAVAEKRGS